MEELGVSIRIFRNQRMTQIGSGVETLAGLMFGEELNGSYVGPTKQTLIS